MFRHTALRYTALVVLAAGALFQAFTAEYFGLEILTEILILAMLVLALDIVAGFGGMVSLCHGALMGVGAYTYALLSSNAGIAPPVAMAGAIAVTGSAAWVIGAVCSRSHGIYFIMATLAFGQMAYSYVFEAPIFGGDDGLGGISRLDLSIIGIDLNDSRSFALFCLAVLGAVYGASVLILRSGLGRSLTGVMHNEQRMRALGLTVWRVKADVFGLSGMIAGLAGALAAQHILLHLTGSAGLDGVRRSTGRCHPRRLGNIGWPARWCSRLCAAQARTERCHDLLAPCCRGHPDRRRDEPCQRDLRLDRGPLGRTDRTSRGRCHAQTAA